MPQYSSYGMSPIRRRNPIGLNVGVMTDAFNNMINSLETKAQSTAQQQSAIDVALSQLPINAAEDEWRYNLGNEVRKQIDAVDNPNDKYLTAIRAAGELMKRPDVVGRIRAEAEYQNFVKQTQARPDIDQRTKNWAIATNAYSYNDITDANGNIVGGTQWKPTNTPVAQVDLSKLGSLAIQWAKPDEAKVSQATFVDEKGDFTNDISKAVDVAYNTSTGWKTVGKDKLMDAINAAIDMTPGARASINQDYDVAMWEYSNLTPEQKNNIGESEVTDGNGRFLTRKEFLAKKLNPWANAASFSNKESTITYGSGLATRMQLKQQAAANSASRLGNSQVNFTSTGFNIVYDTSDYIANAQGKIEDAIRAIEGAMPRIVDTKQWKEAKAEGNYLKLESIIRDARMGNKNYFSLANDTAQNIVNNALTTINNEYSFVGDRLKNLDRATKDAIMFKAAIDAGQRLPDNNEHSKAFYQLLNDISDGKPAEKYKITFNDKSDLDDFLTRMGMNESTATQNGLEFGYDNDFATIIINQNSNLLPKAVINFFEGKDDLFSLPNHRSKIAALGADGNEIGNATRTTIIGNINPNTICNGINGLNSHVNYKVNSFNSAGLGTRTTDQLKVGDIPAIANAKQRYGVDSNEYAKTKKEVYDDLALRLSGSDWTQFGIYGYDEDVRGLTIMPNADRGKEMANIIGHIQDGKASIQFATNGVQHGYYVTLYGKADDDGNYDDLQKTYFISKGVEDEAFTQFINDSNTRAVSEYNRRKSTLGNYRTYIGDNITEINNNTALVNGVPMSATEATKKIEQDKLIDDVVNGIKYGNIPINSQEELNGVILMAVQHIVQNTGVTSQEEAIKIANIILNKIK